MVALHAPDIGLAEQEAVQTCLESGWISSAAPQVAEFESHLKDLTGAGFVVAVQSGTAALHLSLLTHGIGPGDEVMVSDLTFIATVNAVRYTGATPVLIDVEKDSWQMDLTLAKQYLDSTPGKVKAIILVHTLGYPADAQAWKSLANRHGLILIEDAAGAIGSYREESHPGTTGDCGILSFNGNKLVTTGGGGAVLTNTESVAVRVRHLANQAKLPGPAYDHDAVGYNYRMSGLGAVIGLAQLNKLPSMLAAHQQKYLRYVDLMPEALFPAIPRASTPNHWLTTAMVPDRDNLQKAMADAGIQTRPVWTPIHQQLPYQKFQFLSIQRMSTTIHQRALSFPSGAGIDEEAWATIKRVIRLTQT